MGEKRWEDYRLYNKIAFGFEQDIQRLNAQIQKTNAAREQWTRDFNPEQLNAALVSQAETLFAQQQYAQAVPLQRRALANANGRQFNAARMLPEALRRLQPPDVGGAYLAYRELVDRFRDDAPSKAAFGRFLIDLGRWSEAKDVVLLAGSIPEGREVTARALAGEGRYEEAEAEVNGALRMPADSRRDALLVLAAAIKEKTTVRETAGLAERRKVNIEGLERRKALVVSARREFGSQFEDPALDEWKHLDSAAQQVRKESVVKALRVAAVEHSRTLGNQATRDDPRPRLFWEWRERCEANDMETCVRLADALPSEMYYSKYKSEAMRAAADASLAAYRISCNAGFLDSCDSVASKLYLSRSESPTLSEETTQRAIGYWLSLCEFRRRACIRVAEYFSGAGSFLPALGAQRKFDEQWALKFYEVGCPKENEEDRYDCEASEKLKREGLAAFRRK